jgi:hypothetical protein
MLIRSIATAAALSVAATPCLAAELHGEAASGARRSGALVGAYVKLGLDAPFRSPAKPVAGLRLAAVHDYRDALAPTARVLQADMFDLRLTGPAPALYLSGRAITGKHAVKLGASEGGGGRLDTIMLVGAGLLAVGAGAALVLSAD